jgi:cytoskeletal protein RodZ
MIIESIIGVVIIATVGYLFWKNSQDQVVVNKLTTSDPVVEPVAEVSVAEVAPEPVAQPASPAEEKPKRARNKGKFAPDDKTTPEHNEAWIGGKAPPKKEKTTTKPKTPEMKVVKKK